MDKSKYHEMTKNLDNLIEERAFDGKQIYIFGHCEASECLINELRKRNIEPVSIFDNNKSKQGMYSHGVKICSPDSLNMQDSDDMVMLIVARAFDAMKDQLLNMAYRGRIIQLVRFVTYSEQTINCMSETEVCSIKETGNKLIEGFLRDMSCDEVILCPYNALGDVYYAMSYLPYFLKREKWENVLIAVTSEGCRKVAAMFGHEKIMTLDQDTMDLVTVASYLNNNDRVFTPHHDRPYFNTAWKMLGENGSTIEDIYRSKIFGLDQATKGYEPLVLKKYDNKDDIIVEGKTVILAPYAKSVILLPEEYWESIAEKYLAKGYCVLTNVMGEEKPIKGTKAFNALLDEMISAVEMAGAFIGIRSGLCDVIKTAKCRKTVIFPDCYYSSTDKKISEVFALDGWNQVMSRDVMAGRWTDAF